MTPVAEDLDLDRVITDPAYRRRIIARLNHASAVAEADEKTATPSPARLASPPAKFSAAD
jgi:hypothetical protein